MAIPQSILLNGNGSYGVYAGFGSGSDIIGSTVRSNFDDPVGKVGENDKNWTENLSGENYYKDFTRYNLTNSTKWYALDLCEKYNTDSMLKQFHMLTFYFRDTNGKNPSKMIKATLPEQFTYTIGGNWGNPISLSSGDTANAIMQQASQGRASLQQSVDNFLIWQSPKRLELIFKIPIFDDSDNQSRINYQEALNLFGGVVLPSIDKLGYYEKIPGPILTRVLNYLSEEEKQKRGARFANAVNNLVGDFAKTVGGKKPEYDRLTVQVGGLMLIDWCVIPEVKVTFPNTKQMVLHNFKSAKRANHKIHLQPLQAELEIKVATVQSLTRLSYQSMLYLRDQKRPKENTDTQENEEEQEVWEPLIPEDEPILGIDGNLYESNHQLQAGLNGPQYGRGKIINPF